VRPVGKLPALRVTVPGLATRVGWPYDTDV